MTVQSARGLFRATGKVAKVEIEREPADFYATPPEATRAFLRAESDRLSDFPAIWEPACGDGAMAREIESAGHRCIGTDLHDRGFGSRLDFFEAEEAHAPAIVTNPPYNRVNWRDGRGEWVTHALERLGVEYMALLLSWSWPGAAGLSAVWSKWPPARVYLMRWRLDFSGQGAQPALHGWFVFDRRWKGETALRMLDRGSRQEVLP